MRRRIPQPFLPVRSKRKPDDGPLSRICTEIRGIHPPLSGLLHCNSRDSSQAAWNLTGTTADRKIRDRKMKRNPIFCPLFFCQIFLTRCGSAALCHFAPSHGDSDSFRTSTFGLRILHASVPVTCGHRSCRLPHPFPQFRRPNHAGMCDPAQNPPLNLLQRAQSKVHMRAARRQRRHLLA